jgi:deferrochelatase/peroxidase EfeB
MHRMHHLRQSLPHPGHQRRTETGSYGEPGCLYRLRAVRCQVPQESHCNEIRYKHLFKKTPGILRRFLAYKKTPSGEGVQVFDLGGRTFIALGKSAKTGGGTGLRFSFILRNPCAKSANLFMFMQASK